MSVGPALRSEGEPPNVLIAAKAPVPKTDFRTSKLIDGVVWDGKNPKLYVGSFKIKVA